MAFHSSFTLLSLDFLFLRASSHVVLLVHTLNRWPFCQFSSSIINIPSLIATVSSHAMPRFTLALSCHPSLRRYWHHFFPIITATPKEVDASPTQPISFGSVAGISLKLVKESSVLVQYSRSSQTSTGSVCLANRFLQAAFHLCMLFK